jgi:hypothetical protein
VQQRRRVTLKATVTPSVQTRTVVLVDVKKIVGLLAIALLIFFVITQPGAAATSVTNIGDTLYNAAQSITSFFTRLV